MNNQEAFNKVCTHLFKQGERADTMNNVSGSYGCKYRLKKDGKLLMCAAGCLIPDNEYDEKFEERNIDSIIDEIPALKGLNPNLLVSLQLVHDGTPPSNWEIQLRPVAKQYGLDDSILDGLELEVI